MGTKNNPGNYDCYANAAPDEPMFVLLGRDPMAPTLVRLWAQMRESLGEDAAKVREAYDCADAMEAHLDRIGKKKRVTIDEYSAAVRGYEGTSKIGGGNLAGKE